MYFIALVVIGTALSCAILNWIGNMITPDSHIPSGENNVPDDDGDASAYLTDPTSIDYMIFNSDE